MKRYGFSKRERLKRADEFRRAIRFGERHGSKYFVIYVVPNQLGFRRLGLTVGRKVGKAVHRNRIKRIVREYFRLHKYLLKNGMDYSVVVKKGVGKMPSRKLYKDMERLFAPYLETD